MNKLPKFIQVTAYGNYLICLGEDGTLWKAYHAAGEWFIAQIKFSK